MQRNLIMTQSPQSSFLSCEKDIEIILRKLFIEAKPYSDILKRLLVVQAKDCLDKQYDVQEYSIAKLLEDGYITFEPRIELLEHEQVKAYIIISFDNFFPNKSNPEFRDCTINFDVLCHTKYWNLGNYRLRPLKIAGYIDGILNKSKLTGIGQVLFNSCHELILNSEWAGYSLSYFAIHGSDDKIPVNEE